MYLEAQRQKTEYEYTTNTKKRNEFACNGKLSNNMYNDVRIQYKKPNHSELGMQTIQKMNGIERGIMVYVHSEKKVGRVTEERENTYRISFMTEEVLEKPKADVVPMYSNASSNNVNFDSVMRNGVLSPADRAKRGIIPSATTDDKRARNYKKENKIFVNVFSTPPTNPDVQKENTFYSKACGAYLVALENDGVSPLPLPPVEECERYLIESGKNQEVEKYRQELLESGVPEIDVSNFVEFEIFRNYIKKNDEIACVLRTIFEERLKRTMLIITSAPIGESEYGESDTGSISPDRFTRILLPEKGYVTPERRANEKVIIVPSVPEKLNVPAKRYFADAQGKRLDVIVEIVLEVPDYKGEYEKMLKELPGGKYYSHIVRL